MKTEKESPMKLQSFLKEMITLECHLEKWMSLRMAMVKHRKEKTIENPNIEQRESVGTSMESVEVSIGQFVVARYEGKNNKGTAFAIDEGDDTVHVNFMTQSGKCGGRFRWNNTEHKFWIDKEDII